LPVLPDGENRNNQHNLGHGEFQRYNLTAPNPLKNNHTHPITGKSVRRALDFTGFFAAPAENVI
jgi:hypothetical protein